MVDVNHVVPGLQVGIALQPFGIGHGLPPRTLLRDLLKHFGFGDHDQVSFWQLEPGS